VTRRGECLVDSKRTVSSAVLAPQLVYQRLAREQVRSSRAGFGGGQMDCGVASEWVLALADVGGHGGSGVGEGFLNRW
jgi:hypothetical protein